MRLAPASYIPSCSRLRAISSPRLPFSNSLLLTVCPDDHLATGHARYARVPADATPGIPNVDIDMQEPVSRRPVHTPVRGIGRRTHWRDTPATNRPPRRLLVAGVSPSSGGRATAKAAFAAGPVDHPRKTALLGRKR